VLHDNAPCSDVHSIMQSSQLTGLQHRSSQRLNLCACAAQAVYRALQQLGHEINAWIKAVDSGAETWPVVKDLPWPAIVKPFPGDTPYLAAARIVLPVVQVRPLLAAHRLL
jgi:hypothetical protein